MQFQLRTDRYAIADRDADTLEQRGHELLDDPTLSSEERESRQHRLISEAQEAAAQVDAHRSVRERIMIWLFYAPTPKSFLGRMCRNMASLMGLCILFGTILTWLSLPGGDVLAVITALSLCLLAAFSVSYVALAWYESYYGERVLYEELEGSPERLA